MDLKIENPKNTQKEDQPNPKIFNVSVHNENIIEQQLNDTKLFSADDKIIHLANIFSDNKDQQIGSLNFFVTVLKDNDELLPIQYLHRAIDLLIESLQNNDETMSKLILFFFRRCTGFDSDMQTFLCSVDNNFDFLEIIIPFVPANYSLNILGNLAIKNCSFRERLLRTGILKFISNFLNFQDLLLFDDAITFISALIFPLLNFDFTEFVFDINNIFSILHNLYGSEFPEQSKKIVYAFSNYVDADSFENNRFLEHFMSQNFLLKFIQEDIKKESVYKYIILICESIVNTYQDEGVKHLLYDASIIEWISDKLYSKSPNVLRNSYQLLFELLDYERNLVDEYIKNNFIVQAVDNFYDEESNYRIKVILYKFCCLVFSSSTNNNIILLINDRVLNLIVSNVILLEDEEDEWCLVLDALLRLQPILCEEIVQTAIEKIRCDDDFIEWFGEKVRNCDNPEIDRDSEIISEFLIGAGEEGANVFY